MALSPAGCALSAVPPSGPRRELDPWGARPAGRGPGNPRRVFASVGACVQKCVPPQCLCVPRCAVVHTPGGQWLCLWRASAPPHPQPPLPSPPDPPQRNKSASSAVTSSPGALRECSLRQGRGGPGGRLESPDCHPLPCLCWKIPPSRSPKVCQHPLLETEKYQPENGFSRSGLWKKGGLGGPGPPFCPEGRPLQKRKPAYVCVCLYVCVYVPHVCTRPPPPSPGGSGPRD